MAVRTMSPNVSDLESLISRAGELSSKVDFWNNAVLVALFVTAIAAAGIVAAQRKAFVRAKELSDVQDQISGIKEAASQLELARLTKENLTLQSDLLKLREKMADRHLTPDQQKNVSARLRPFAKTRLNFFAMAGDSEIIGISEEVLKVLADPHLSNWSVTVGSGQDSSILSSGILVQVSLDADAGTKNAASALIAALKTEGLAVSGPLPPSQGAIMGNIARDPLAKIRIVVAKKPTE
jgi:hypothetical protein